jgi:NodT family efflux transporter outer membrane factor (OMF) lipoprotein
MRQNLTLRPDSALTAVGLVVAAIAGSMLSGCAVGPDYKTPAEHLAPFHSTAAAATVAAPAPLDAWWKGFNDPELDRIIERVLAQNLDLAASLARVHQARAAAREAGARLLPSGELSAQVDSMHQSLDGPIGQLASVVPGYDRNGTQSDVGVGASWEIDLSGGLRRGEQAADAEAQAAEADHLGVRVSVAAEAADAYLQVRGDQARLRLAQQQIATDAHLLELVQRRRASGAATDREVAQAQALVAQAQATVPPLRISLEAQLNRLDVLMGAQAGTYAQELSSPADTPDTPALPTEMSPGEMLRRRPDVIAAERRLAATSAQIGVAVSEYYPKLSISGLLGFETLDNGVSVRNLFSAAAFQPQAIAGLRWRLFDFGKVDAEVAQANSANAVALAQYRQSVLRAAEDVENAFNAFVQLGVQTQQVKNEVEALTRARETSEEAYKAGAIPLTDVLDADRQLLTAQDESARLRADAACVAVASFRAMGGGWQPAPAPMGQPGIASN